MNRQQKAKLNKLRTAEADAQIELAKATKALEAAGDDAQKKTAAEEGLKAAQAAVEAATRAHNDYQAELDTKAAGGGNAGGKKADAKSGAIIVTAHKDRRRAGHAFPKGQPVAFEPGELTEGQIAAINADPVLSLKLS